MKFLIRISMDADTMQTVIGIILIIRLSLLRMLAE